MPKVFEYRGWRFHFFSYEGQPREPLHVHVAKPGRDAKLWLYPEVRVAYNRGLNAKEMRIVLDVVIDRREEIEEAWNEYFARADEG